MTWNLSDKGSSVTLSGGDLIATNTALGGGWSSVRDTISKSSGKWAWSCTYGAADAMLGVANASADVASFCGADANGFGWNFNDGRLYHSGSIIDSSIDVPTLGDVITVLMDLDGKTLKFLKNGVPVSSKDANISALSGPVFPMATVGFFTTNGTVTLNETPSGLPSGYSPISGAVTAPSVAHVYYNTMIGNRNV